MLVIGQVPGLVCLGLLTDHRQSLRESCKKGYGMAFRKEKPLISVVIPSYNHSKFVSKTIESVIDQTIFNLMELIVIDDGSTDNSVEVIKQTLRKYPRENITFITRENRGLCRTLNEGLRLSRGKYFSYIGSDDLLHPEKFEKQVAAMNASGDDTAACYTDSFMIDAAGKITDVQGRIYPFHGGDIYHDLLKMRLQPPSPSNLFLREAVISCGGFDESHFIEDKSLWVKIARKYKVAYIDEPLTYFRLHGGNTSINNIGKMHEYLMQVVCESVADDPSLTPMKRSLEANILGLEAASYFEALQLDKARVCAIQALFRDPLGVIGWRTLVLSLLGKNALSYIRQMKRSLLQAQFAEGLVFAGNNSPALARQPVWAPSALAEIGK